MSGQGIAIVWRWDDLFSHFASLIDFLIEEGHSPSVVSYFVSECMEIAFCAYPKCQQLIPLREPDITGLLLELFGEVNQDCLRDTITDIDRFFETHYRLLTDIAAQFHVDNQQLGHIEADWDFDRGPSGGDAYLIFYPIQRSLTVH